MERTFKILCTGVAIAAAFEVAGFGMAEYGHHQYAIAVTDCEKEHPQGPWLDYQIVPMRCNIFDILEKPAKVRSAAQNRLVDASSGPNWRDWAHVGAIAVLLLLSLPAAWNFFLCRLRELSAAIAGRPK